MIQELVAIGLMEKMEFPEEIKNAFINDNVVYIFEDGEPSVIKDVDVLDKIEDLQADGNVVYGVIHNEIFGGRYGDIYNFLIVPKYQEDWDKLLFCNIEGCFKVESYCMNVTDEVCSEPGYIVVKDFVRIY